MTTQWLVGAGGLLVMAYLFRELLLPVVLAGVLAYLLNPLVSWAEAFAIRRTVAVAALYLGVLVLLIGGGMALGPSLGDEAAALAEGLPALADQLDGALDMATRELSDAVPALRRWLPPDAVVGRRWTSPLLEGQGGRLGEVVEHAGQLFVLAILVPFFAFFMLRDSRRLVARLLDLLPPDYVETSVAVWREAERIIGRYLRGVALDGLAVGALATLGLWLLHVRYPLLLGAFTGLANAVPFLGPVLAAAAAGLVVLTGGQGLTGVLRVAILFLVIKIADDALLQPLTVGRSVRLHPMLLLPSVIVGNQALGILGMIVAVPVVTIAQEMTRLLLAQRRGRRKRGIAGEAPAAATYLS